jgi:hypothetical protein
MATELTLDEIRARALHAGLRLADEELRKLLPGVNRSHKQAAELREFMTDTLEPAEAFSASQREIS